MHEFQLLVQPPAVVPDLACRRPLVNSALAALLELEVLDGIGEVDALAIDAGISHEYRLVKGADHVGASLVPRSLDAFAFIGRQLNPPRWIDDTALKFREAADQNKKARGYPVTPFDPNRIHAE